MPRGITGGAVSSDEVTHFVPYTPDRIGKDWVESSCGKLIHIRDFSARPSCPACKLAANVHRLKLARERRA